MVICGAIGTAAATWLTVEYIGHLKNPHYVPVCNLNPIFSCSSVMTSNQAHLFGFPNELIGIGAFASIMALGLGLLAGARFKSWFWKMINAGAFLAVVFVTYLQFQTLYRIGALCIFCMITWLVTIPLFWYVTLYNLRAKNISFKGRLNQVAAFALRHHLDILVLWFLIIIALILKRFWYYYGW